VSFTDERDHAEEAANQRLMAEETEPDHCTNCGADVGQVLVRPSAGPGRARLHRHHAALRPLRPLHRVLNLLHGRGRAMVAEFDLGLLETRHATGDWGDTHLEDARANDDAVRDGDHIVSSYPLACGDERCRYIDYSVAGRT
jgi:hypothetical protein